MSLLGATAVRAELGPVALRSSVRRRLLELLAIHAGEPVPVDVIVAELWPTVPPEWPKEAVQALARRLRRTFTDRGVTGLRVVAVADGYLLDLRPDAVDALHMVELVEQAPEDDDERLVRRLDRALALWVGEPFGGMVAGPHHQQAVRRWREVRAQGLRLWAAAQLRLGRPKPVISKLRAERVGDFADEDLYRLLVEALNQLGRAAESRSRRQSGGDSSR